MVHISSPDYVEAVLASLTHTYKSPAYKKMSEWLGTGLIVNSGPRWHRDRKLLTPAFHFKILEQFNVTTNKNAQIFCDVISEQGYQLNDVMDTVSNLTLDNLLESSFGYTARLQRYGSNDYSTNFHLFAKLFVSRYFYPLYYTDIVYHATPSGAKWRQAIKKLHKFTTGIVVKRKMELLERKFNKNNNDKIDKNNNDKNNNNDSSTTCKSMLDLMLDIHIADDQLTLDDIRSQLDNFAFAGHDT